MMMTFFTSRNKREIAKEAEQKSQDIFFLSISSW